MVMDKITSDKTVRQSKLLAHTEIIAIVKKD